MALDINIEELNASVEDLYERKLTRTRILGHVSSIREEIEKEESGLSVLIKTLEKSEEKLDDLQELSVRSILAKIVGNKEEKISEEREAYLEAAMNYSNGMKKVEAMKYEEEVLLRKAKGLENVQEELDRALDKKMKYLTRKNPQKAKLVIDKDLELKRFDFYLKELSEADDAANVVLEELQSVEQLIRQIKSWRPYGHADIRRRGYRLEPSFRERNFLKSKLKNLPQLDIALSSFIVELKDISNRYQLPYEALLKRVEHFLIKLYRGLMTDLSFQMETQNVAVELSVFKRNVHDIKVELAKESERASDEKIQKRRAFEELLVEMKL